MNRHFLGSKSQIQRYQRIVRSLCEDLVDVWWETCWEEENSNLQMQFKSYIQPGEFAIFNIWMLEQDDIEFLNSFKNSFFQISNHFRKVSICLIFFLFSILDIWVRRSLGADSRLFAGSCCHGFWHDWKKWVDRAPAAGK